MNRRTEKALADCHSVLEETGDLQACLNLYPDLDGEIRAHFALAGRLTANSPPPPGPSAAASGRQSLLSALAVSQPVGSAMPARFSLLRPAAVLAGFVLLAGAGVGASAASGGAVPLPGPVSDVLDVVGLGQSEHGKGVSDAVHDAIDGSTPGPGRGQAVSTAACEAAHDRGTLPSGAQSAPGQQDRPPRECATPSPGASAESPSSDGETPSDHGTAVSGAVHGAIDGSTPGPERGKAVSEAACEAAHDRTTLPTPAKDAPGQQDRGPKECEHPGDAGVDDQGGPSGAGNDQGEGPPADKPGGPPADPPGRGR